MLPLNSIALQSSTVGMDTTTRCPWGLILQSSDLSNGEIMIRSLARKIDRYGFQFPTSMTFPSIQGWCH